MSTPEKKSTSLFRQILMSTLLAAVAIGGPGGCASDEGEVLDATCNGDKCDAFDSIRSYWDDARSIDLGDLMSLGARLTTDELNSALSTDFGGISIGAPTVYALADDAEGDLTLKNIDSLVSGLAARFGDKSLSTEVNRIRQRHLEDSGDRYYGESAFALKLGGNHSWGFNVGGIENTHVSVGFEAAATLEARVIAAYDKEKDAILQSPLAAAREQRGFIIPRDSDDVLDMKPGESFALAGDGALGINLGAGVPLLVADPGEISYSIVFSAALRSRLSGSLDVQLVRLEGDDVVVDVGMEKVRSSSARLAINDGWGVSGLVQSRVSVGSLGLDLGKLADKAIRKELNKSIELIDAHAERTKLKARMSMARFRFTLDPGDNESMAAMAMTQALRGDVRLAQALANRGEPGVIAEFDLMRSGVTTNMHAGIDIFGMSFYAGEQETEGQAVIQTPGGTLSLLFESLHNESGWFFSTHANSRTGLAGLLFDAQNPVKPQGETNMVIQLVEGDKDMEADKLIDHLDGAILALAGEEAYKALDAKGNELERYVRSTCRPGPQDAWNSCRVDIVSDPAAVKLRSDALTALESKTGHLSQDQQALVMRLGEERVRAQAAHEYAAAWVGPSTSIVTNYRLDDAALASMMSRDGSELTGAITRYLKAVEVDRRDSATKIASARTNIENDTDHDAVRDVFNEASQNYRQLLNAEEVVIEGLGSIGSNALELRFEVDRDNRPVYEDAAAQSLARVRMNIATGLYDDLIEKVSGHRAQHIVSYALLALVPSEHLDFRLDAKTELDSAGFDDTYRVAGYDDFDLYVKGDDVKPIDAGMFSLDSLLNMEN